MDRLAFDKEDVSVKDFIALFADGLLRSQTCKGQKHLIGPKNVEVCVNHTHPVCSGLKYLGQFFAGKLHCFLSPPPGIYHALGIDTKGDEPGHND
jgi:hypothetical protein